MKNRNIVFFVTRLDSGGLENYLLRFLNEKHMLFDNIYVYCKGGKGGQLEDDYLKLNNVRVIKKKLGFFDLLGYWSLISFLKENSIEVVCDFTGNFAGLILLTSKFSNVSKRVAFYRSSSDRFKKGLGKSMYNDLVRKLVLKYSTSILSNSQAAFDYFFPGKWQSNIKFNIVYNGIDASSFTKNAVTLRKEMHIPSEAFVVGHTGRYNPAKNHSTILKVAEELIKLDENIYFILCGNGVKSNLNNVIIKNGLTEKVLVFENRNDIPSFLKTMDCYFFPSITEGQPNSLIEAMVIGIPFVASNINAIKETIPANLQNELIDPLNWKDAVEKIVNIKNDFQYTQQLIIQDWAENKFDAQRQFKLFNSYL